MGRLRAGGRVYQDQELGVLTWWHKVVEAASNSQGHVPIAIWGCSAHPCLRSSSRRIDKDLLFIYAM